MDEETPREKMLSSQEILSTIEWSDVLQGHNTALEAIGLFDTHMSIILEEMMKVKSKKFSRFLKDVILSIARPIKAIHRIKEYIAAEPTSELAQSVQNDQNIFEAFEERISCMVNDLVSKVVATWGNSQVFQLRLSPELDNEVNNQHYLLVYLILLLLDHWVAPEEMEASSTYFEYANPKYRKFSPRGPNAAPAPKKDTQTSLRHMKSMMDMCSKCHLSIEDLLVWKPTPVFSTGVDENDDSYDEEALLEDNYPLSETGITTLVSGMIYAMINPTQLSSTYTLPLTLAQDWVFTTAGGLASGFLTSDDSQLAMADKGLLILLYAIDRTPLNEFKMETLDYCTMDSSTDRMGLFQIFQVMVSFAATCSSSSHRFFCFQALDRLVQACEDGVKMYLLEQLVSPKCPYETMRAAAVNLVKATVERAFLNLDQARKENTEKIRADTAGGDASSLAQVKSPFTSPLLLKTFLPSIWRFDVKAFEQSPLSSEDVWIEKYDMLMHALNFYLFLLMRDSREDNLTEVWLVSTIQETHKEFVEPLMERILELKEDYIQRLIQVETDHDAVFDDDFDSPMHRIKSKNGIVDFDIDIDSEDDDDDDDEEATSKAKKPKDTVLDLSQKMMKVEIMDELLERIQELTSPLIQDE
ncbi:hypothetical protein BGX21_005173 [Mortierella sp. AD011]|nr:hypothetical protein BGX20_005978 [Mortierella sp. AD010]KAF9400007.1 hypothetical protein BGX21_005173 [Mortierella sp. AD011]